MRNMTDYLLPDSNLETETLAFVRSLHDLIDMIGPKPHALPVLPWIVLIWINWPHTEHDTADSGLH